MRVIYTGCNFSFTTQAIKDRTYSHIEADYDDGINVRLNQRMALMYSQNYAICFIIKLILSVAQVGLILEYEIINVETDVDLIKKLDVSVLILFRVIEIAILFYFITWVKQRNNFQGLTSGS